MRSFEQSPGFRRFDEEPEAPSYVAEPVAAPIAPAAPAAPARSRATGMTPDIAQAIRFGAEKFGVDEAVLVGMGDIESIGYNPDVISGKRLSPRGAIGMMQFMPDTAKRFGIDPRDPAQSAIGAAAYMRAHLDMFDGDYDKAVAAYNWGEGAVQKAVAKWGDKWLDHAPEETRKYVAFIRDFRSQATPQDPAKLELPEGVKPSEAGGGRGMMVEEPGARAASLETVSSDKSLINAQLDQPFTPISGTRAGLRGAAKPTPKSVMEGVGQDPVNQIERRGAPVTAETAQAARQALANATPAERALAASQPGWIGAVARAQNSQLAADDRSPEQIRRGIGTRQAREELYRSEGLDPQAAQERVTSDIAAGRAAAPLPSANLTQEQDRAVQTAIETGQEMRGSGFASRVGARTGLALGKGALGVAQFVADVTGQDDVSSNISKSRTVLDARENAIPDAGGVVGQAEKALSSVLMQLPHIALGAAGGGLAPILAQAAIQQFGDSYTEGKKRGLGVTESATRAGLMAAAEVVFERFGMGEKFQAFRNIANGSKNPIEKTFALYLDSQKKEIPAEMATTLSQFMVDKAPGIGTNQRAGTEELLSQLGDTIAQTMLGGGATFGAAHAAGAAVRAIVPDQPPAPQSLFSKDSLRADFENMAKRRGETFGSDATREAGLPDLVVPKGPAPTQVEDKPTVSARLPKMPNADQAAQPPVAESLAPAQEAGDAGVAPGQEAARPAPMSNPRAPAADATGVDLASQAPLPSAPNVEPRGVEPSVTTPDGGVTDIVGRQTVQTGPALTTTAAPERPAAAPAGRSLTGKPNSATANPNSAAPPQAALLKEAPVPGVSQPPVRTELPEVEPAPNARPALLDGSYTGDVLAAPEQPFANKSQANLFRDKNQLKGWEAAPIANGWVLRPTSLEPTIGELRHAGQAVTQLQGLQVGGAAPFAGVTLADAMPADTGRAVGVARVAARSLGINLVPVNGLASDGLYVDNQPHAAFVAADSSKPILFVAGHEVYHALKRLGGSVVGDFEQAVSAYLRPEVVANRQAEEEAGALPGQQMQGRGREEVVADVNGAMWLDPKFWREVMLRSPDLFQKVSAAFMEVATKIRAALTRNPAPEAKQFVTDVDAVRKLVAQMTVDARKGAPVKAGDSRKVDSDKNGAIATPSQSENANSRNAVSANPGQPQNAPADKNGAVAEPTTQNEDVVADDQEMDDPDTGFDDLVDEDYNLRAEEELDVQDAPEVGYFASKRPGSDIGHKREKTSGRYVGAPDWVGDSPSKLGQLRKKLRKLAEEGAVGRFWYENSSRAILALAGGDKVEAEKFVGLIAIYSPNATVPANTSMALKAWFQYKAGLPIKAGFGAANRKAEDLLRHNKPWEGIKTNSFYQNLMVEIDPSKLESGTATMDMWMAIAFDYGLKVLDQGPKYKFAERETNRLADELGWSAHQVQAAIWVAMKGRIDPIRPQLKNEERKRGWLDRKEEIDDKGNVSVTEPVKKEFKRDHFRLAHQMGMDASVSPADFIASKYDFSDAIEERTVQMSWEATPGKSTGVLPGIHSATTAQRMEYLLAVNKALTDDAGRDLIAMKVGLPGGRTMFGFSAWEGDIGAGAQTMTATALEGNKDKRDLTPEARRLFNTYAAVKGYVLAQEAVVWHVPIYDSTLKNQNGFEARFDRALNEEEMRLLYGEIHREFDTWEVAPGYTADGFRALNFVEGLDSKKFQAGMAKVMSRLPADFGGSGEAKTAAFRSVGDYIGNDWSAAPNGEQYEEVFAPDRGTGRSDLQEWAAGIRARVETVNREFSERYSWGQPVIEPQILRSARPAEPADRPGTGGWAGAGGGTQDARGWSKRAPQPGSVTVDGWHYGKSKVPALSGTMYGSGIKGAEADRLAQSRDRRIKSRVYFYINRDDGTPPPKEDGLGPHKYEQRLSNLYDPASRDPRIPLARNGANEFESAILDAGFDGYIAPAFGMAVVLDATVPAKYVGEDKAGPAPITTPVSQRAKKSLMSREIFEVEPLVPQLQKVDPTLKYEAGRVTYDPAAKDALNAEMERAGTGIRFSRREEPRPRIGLFMIDSENYESAADSRYRMSESIGMWTAFAPGNNDGEISFMTESRQEAARWLTKTFDQDMAIKGGRDLYKENEEGAKRAIAGFKALAQVKGAFERNNPPPTKDINWIFKLMSTPRSQFRGVDVSDPPYFKVYYDRPATAENPPRKMVALLAPKEDRDGNVIGYYADTSSLGETGRGADFYQAAFAWAKANKVKLQPDDVLTLINTFRRTEQMLSAALRLGTTKWMNPHLDQRIYGWNENPKNQQEDDENLGRLILATVRNLEESVPEAYKVWYNPTSGKFGGDDGRTLDYGTEVAPLLAAGAARSAGIGRSTLARGLLARDLIAGKLDASSVARGYGADLLGGGDAAEPGTGRAVAGEDAAVRDRADAEGDGTLASPVFYSRRQPPPGGFSIPAPAGRFTLDPESEYMRNRRVVQDRFVRLREVQKMIAEQGGLLNDDTDAYLAEERSHGRVGFAIDEFKDKWMRPFTEKAAKVGVDLDELSLYAYAKHAEERNRHIASINPGLPDGGSGMKTADAQAIIARFQAQPNFQDIRDLHNDLMAVTQASRDLLWNEGLISDDEYTAWSNQYSDYIPLRGFEGVDPETGVRTGGRGINVRGGESMRALGRRSRAGNLIENVIADYERAVLRAEKNEIGRTFYRFVQANPDSKLWEVDPVKRTRKYDPTKHLVVSSLVEDVGPDTIAFKEDGKEVHIKIHDEALLRTMRASYMDETGQFQRVAAETLGVFNGYLRNTLTRWNPGFVVINTARDFQTANASVVDKLGFGALAKYNLHVASAAAVAWRNERGTLVPGGGWDKWMTEFRAAGGATGGFFGRDVERIASDLRGMLIDAGATVQPKGSTVTAKAIDRAVIALRGNRAAKVAAATAKLVESMGGMSENMFRVAAYRTAREMGKSPAQAASIAKNLTTNFNRRGEVGLFLNSAYLFFNASLQGAVRTLQYAKNPKMAAVAAAGVALGLTAAMLGADAGEEDGESYWDMIPDYIKERNLVIMLPPSEDKTLTGERIGKKGRYIKIPLAYGLNFLPVLGYGLADSFRHAQDPSKGRKSLTSAARVANAFLGSYNPLGGGVPKSVDEAWLMALPTVADIPYTLTQEIDSFGRKAAPEKTRKEEPDSERAFMSDRGTAQHRVARWLNQATGGNKAQSGAIDITPATIEGAVRYATGGTGTFIMDVLSTAGQALGEEKVKSQNVPFLKALYGEVDSKAIIRDFYENRDEIEKSYAQLMAATKMGVPIPKSKQNDALYELGGYLQGIQKGLTELRKWEVDAVSREMSEDPEARKSGKADRERVEAEKAKLMRAFNKHYRKTWGAAE